MIAPANTQNCTRDNPSKSNAVRQSVACRRKRGCHEERQRRLSIVNFAVDFFVAEIPSLPLRFLLPVRSRRVRSPPATKPISLAALRCGGVGEPQMQRPTSNSLSPAPMKNAQPAFWLLDLARISHISFKIDCLSHSRGHLAKFNDIAYSN